MQLVLSNKKLASNLRETWLVIDVMHEEIVIVSLNTGTPLHISLIVELGPRPLLISDVSTKQRNEIVNVRTTMKH